MLKRNDPSHWKWVAVCLQIKAKINKSKPPMKCFVDVWKPVGSPVGYRPHKDPSTWLSNSPFHKDLLTSSWWPRLWFKMAFLIYAWSLMYFLRIVTDLQKVLSMFRTLKYKMNFPLSSSSHENLTKTIHVLLVLSQQRLHAACSHTVSPLVLYRFLLTLFN